MVLALKVNNVRGVFLNFAEFDVAQEEVEFPVVGVAELVAKLLLEILILLTQF